MRILLVCVLLYFLAPILRPAVRSMPIVGDVVWLLSVFNPMTLLRQYLERRKQRSAARTVAQAEPEGVEKKPAVVSPAAVQAEPSQQHRNPLRIFVLVMAAVLMCFGAILLADGFADASNRIPGSGKRYMDGKEMAIAASFLVGAGVILAVSCGVLRPRYTRRSTLYRTALALGCGLILSLALRGVDVRFNKPHWFTTNVPVKIPLGRERYWDTQIRARALVESLNDMFRGIQ
jgi:hypothetical protein